MDLNVLCMGGLMTLAIYTAYTAYTIPLDQTPGLSPPEQAGRSKYIQSKTGDASMFIQAIRRTATKNGGFGWNNMAGAIDYWFISRKCVCPPAVIAISGGCCCGALDGNGGGADYDGGSAGQLGFNMDGGGVGYGNCCCDDTDGGLASMLTQVLYDGNFYDADGGGAGNIPCCCENTDGGSASLVADIFYTSGADGGNAVS